MYIINCCIFLTAVLLSPYSVHYQTLCAYYLVVTLNLKCRITFRVQRHLWVSFINWVMYNSEIRHLYWICAANNLGSMCQWNIYVGIGYIMPTLGG